MEEENQEVTQTETATETIEAPSLTVTDLTNIKQLIDVVSTRGVFKPEEMVAVGTVYSKLTTFLSSIQAQSNQG